MAGKRIAKLDIEGCQHEIARIYREARREELDLSRAKGLVWILKELSGLIRDSGLEKRVAELEERI